MGVDCEVVLAFLFELIVELPSLLAGQDGFRALSLNRLSLLHLFLHLLLFVLEDVLLHEFMLPVPYLLLLL